MSLLLRLENRLRLSQARANVAGARGPALQAGGEVIRSVAVPLAPLDTGALRGSAVVTNDGERACVSFNTPYAVVQHERTWYQHRDGQAKFLTSALPIASPDVNAVMAATIRRALR